ncbi:MAG TPA: hypothetical protein VGD98_24845 [Ktedonobacteraceae bacterium]
MDAESQIALLLTRVDAGIKELEQTVENFEQTVSLAEQRMNEAQPHAGEKAELQLVTHALQACQNAATLVRAANTELSDTLAQAETTVSASLPTDDAGPLQPGTLICDGRYRLIQLLHRRPRVHLYLARRQSASAEQVAGEQPLVAIRELLLSGLTPVIRQHVVRAAFEEFAAPQIFGSSHLPGVGDHLYLEDKRHYLIMQPRQARGNVPARAMPLSEVLVTLARLDLTTALHVGTRLCQTVARLHRLNLHLGELTPTMILIDPNDDAHWAPLLLAAWPPAPHFWPGQSQQMAQQISEQIFPTTAPECQLDEQDSRPFAAPEIFTGLRDARSDVYSLGAILYLLCTGSAPPAASQRLRASAGSPRARGERQSTRQSRRSQATPQPTNQDATLITPRLLNEEISPLLEQIFLRALALKPELRFASVRDLAEALESMHLKTELPDIPAIAPPFPRAKASRLRRLLEWLKR